MKTIIAVSFLVLASASYAQDFEFLKGQAAWSLQFIDGSSNAKQRASHMRNINAYAAVLQEYLSQKPTPCVGDPHAFIEHLAKQVRAKQAEQRRIAELEQRQRMIITEKERSANYADYAAEQRLRRLENEVESQRIRAREAAERANAAAKQEAYRRATGR